MENIVFLVLSGSLIKWASFYEEAVVDGEMSFLLLGVQNFP